jgi:hypothetical protein
MRPEVTVAPVARPVSGPARPTDPAEIAALARRTAEQTVPGDLDIHRLRAARRDLDITRHARHAEHAGTGLVRRRVPHRRRDRRHRAVRRTAPLAAMPLARLAGLPVDYHFTDLSAFFLNAARERFADHPWMRYGIVDMNRDLRGTTERYDIVIGANVLHNALHIGEMLRDLHDLLGPGGAVVFIEACKANYPLLTSMKFLMSAAPGGTHPGKEDIRQGARIFLTEDEWCEQLRSAGFTPLLVLPERDHPMFLLDQRVIAAIRPRPVVRWPRQGPPDYRHSTGNARRSTYRSARRGTPPHPAGDRAGAIRFRSQDAIRQLAEAAEVRKPRPLRQAGQVGKVELGVQTRDRQIVSDR